MKELHSNLPEIILHPLQKGSARFAHPWIYRSQIKTAPKGIPPGAEVLVKSSKGAPIGIGYYNPASEIVIRMLTKEIQPIDRDFFLRQLRKAVDYRKCLKINSDAIRWVNTESDQLPGLIVDQYADTAVVQFLTLGMDARRALILDAVGEILKPRAIYERSDGVSRRLEGLPIQKGWAVGDGPTKIQIQEGRVRYWVDIENGHKTGFYLDQRDNRAFFSTWPDWSGQRILDCFTHTGGFAIAAAVQGAKQVIGLDLSETVLDLARENARLNGTDVCDFRKENVFDFLRRCEEEGETFDAIVLDPPSFTRTKGTVEKAHKGYKEIHLRAMKILKSGGMLLTFCCSHHLGMEDFQKIILEAARDVRCSLKVVQWLTQAKDHPVLLTVPETLYLKGFVLQKVS